MTVINTNTASINAQFNLNKVNQEMEKAMEQLSSGKRINTAADDAAGLSIATRMESQLRGLQQAISNAGDGQNMAATAEGSMDEITNMLQRMRELALQASNDTMNDQDRGNLNNEMSQLKAEIDRVVETTAYNNVKLLDGSLAANLQIGSQAGEDLNFKISSMSTSQLGSSTSALALNAATDASASGKAAVENVVNLTFNGNDSYGFKIVLANATGTGSTNKEITITGAQVAAYSAQDVADKINQAVASNHVGAGAGANITGSLTATVSGTTVTLNNKEGSSIDVTNFTSSGAGTVTVNPVTNTTAAAVTLEDNAASTSVDNTNNNPASASTSSIQLEEGKKFQFRVNDTLVEVDATAAGIAASTNGDIASLISDTATAIQTAVDASSGTGNASVVTSGSVNGTSLQFRISDSSGKDIDISGFSKVTSGQVSAGFLTVELDAQNATPAPKTIENAEFLTADQATNATGLAIAAGKTGRMQFSNQDLSYTFKFAADGTNQVAYTIDGATKDFNAEVSRVADAISAAGGVNVTATNNGGLLEIVNNTAGALSFDGATAIASPGVSAVAAGAAYYLEGTAADNDMANDTGAVALVDGAVVRSTNGSEAIASQMSLTFSANDRYTIGIDVGGGSTADNTFSFDVVNGSLTAAANTINASSSTTNITASVSSSELILTKADGTAFSVLDFSSESGGQINAANAAGQGASRTLENAGDGASAAIAASGVAVPTTVDLAFSAAADKYAFKISDGSTTATVRATEVWADGKADMATPATDAGSNDTDTLPEAETILAEITSALSAANMSHIVASILGDKITLTNNLGGEINIKDFRSDGTGEMTVSPGAGQGVGKILNDDALNSSYDSIASMDALTVSSSQAAIQAIDRALENVNAQRAELGAISNRLDHTISNLGNVIINTEASQSRIEDADFAKVTGDLTKSQIMSQAATAMLAQANASKQGVLSLLQG